MLLGCVGRGVEVEGGRKEEEEEEEERKVSVSPSLL
jgi:hypothetical protein